MGVGSSSPPGAIERLKVIAPSVRVPVLSVNRSWTLPRSSIATSRFTRTLLFANSLAPEDRLTVTMAGIISGVIPTAMASENRSASSNGLCRPTLMAKMATVRTAATNTRKRENPRRPDWKAVSAGRSERPAAMRPNSVASPVDTTTPRPEPWCTIVPMKAQDGRSTSDDCGAASMDLVAGVASPVKIASSHSSSFASRRRTSAGTRSPIPSATTSPGTSWVTSTWCARPSLHTRARRWILSCSASTATSARYSLKNPSAMLRKMMTAMITASVGSPVTPETPAHTSSSRMSGLRTWPTRTSMARTR